MRIIAGKHRGRVLAAFQGEEVRPTSDRVKESVFQILSSRLAGARVLDLFCGSGALGIECLSRGAGEVLFNDIRKESIALTKKNLALVGEGGAVTCLDFRRCLSGVRGQFDLIFSDPPYREDYLCELLRLVGERDLLCAGGLVVHESEREESAPAGWERADFRRYGRTEVSFFRPISSEREDTV